MTDKNLKTFDELKEWTGFSNKSAIARALTEMGIKYITSKDGICTTMDAINVGLGAIKSTPKNTIRVK